MSLSPMSAIITGESMLKKEEKAEHKCNAQCHKNGAGHIPSHGEKGHKCTDACKKK